MAGMGEGVDEQVLIREAMVQRRFRPFQQCVQNVRPMRSQRIAEIQVQGFSHSADPSVEKNMIAARPTTFSAGTKPTPPPLASGPSGKRLSALSSRLSPIIKYSPYVTLNPSVSTQEPPCTYPI